MFLHGHQRPFDLMKDSLSCPDPLKIRDKKNAIELSLRSFLSNERY